ncbi:hypothetical protein SAMN04489725_11616 [Alicyclobacillus hesperidum]|uniref:Uncharacterized protein n=1 Tax=Alicyclobacillus hesperidum TaxID=89784 RepID=A0A1H2WPR5_9BACL|nr:hypothetical protein SAMN04489725_11616 [Alicyclobacillus hesperidum]
MNAKDIAHSVVASPATSLQTSHTVSSYTPFSYFFEVGFGLSLGVLLVWLPGMWFYRRFLQQRAE